MSTVEEAIKPTKWYVVSGQGVECGPYNTYPEARAMAKDTTYIPMIGEEVIDTFEGVYDED